MATHRLSKVLEHLKQSLAPQGASAIPDGQLLSRFVAAQDEAAFAALLRHAVL
jgi:hypothetical protein